MKKKIYKYLSVAVIAVAMAVSFQMSRANNATDLTMENIEALAMADGDEYSDNTDGNCCASAEIEYCYYNGQSYYASKECD